LAYAPFAFLNLLNPLVSILYGYTGFTMEKMDPEEVENNKKEEIETDKTNTEAK
jgi:Na+/H+ antiporter NhaC